MMRNSSLVVAVACATACVLAFAGDTCNWTGAENGFWTNANNWAEGRVPGRYFVPDGNGGFLTNGTTGCTAVFGDQLSGEKATAIDFDGVYSISNLTTSGTSARYTYGTDADQMIPIEPFGRFSAGDTPDTPVVTIACKLQLGVECMDEAWGGEAIQIWNNSSEKLVVGPWGFRTRHPEHSTKGECATRILGTGDIQFDEPYECGESGHYTHLSVMKTGGKLIVNTRLKVRLLNFAYFNYSERAVLREVEITENGSIEPISVQNYLSVSVPTRIYGPGSFYLAIGKINGNYVFNGFSVSSQFTLESPLKLLTDIRGYVMTEEDLQKMKTRLLWSGGSGTFTKKTGACDFVGEISACKSGISPVIEVESLGLKGTSGSLGDVDFELGNGATLRYIGSGETTDRAIACGTNGTKIINFEHAGTGDLVLQSRFSRRDYSEGVSVRFVNSSTNVLVMDCLAEYGVGLRLDAGVFEAGPNLDLRYSFGIVPPAELWVRESRELKFLSADSYVEGNAFATVYVADGAELTIDELYNRWGGRVDFKLLGPNAKVTAKSFTQDAAGSQVRLNGRPAKIDAEGNLVYDETNISSYAWAFAQDGLWTDATKWLNGVPDAERPTEITADGDDYTVLISGTDAAVTNLTIGQSFGTATLLVTNADATAASLTTATDAQVTIRKGGCLAMGGDSTFTGTGIANSGTIVNVEDGGVFRTTGGTVNLFLPKKPSATSVTAYPIRMKGGLAEFVDTKVVYRPQFGNGISFTRYFGTGTMRFDGEAEMVYDSGADGSHTQYNYIQPSNNGEEARLEFCGNSARTVATGSKNNYWSLYIGGKPGKSTLLFDTGTTKSMANLGNQVNVGYCYGTGELLVKRGNLNVGTFTMSVGGCGSDTVSPYAYNVTGVVEVCKGATLTYNGNAGRNLSTQESNYGSKPGNPSWNRAPGLMVGHGIANQNAGSYFRGEVRLAGKLVNYYGSFFVGSGSCGDGEVIQTDGTFESQNVGGDTATTNEVAIGLFGGTGVYRMSGGEFKTRKNVYVGGATCDDLHREITNVVMYLHQFHNAKGRVSVSGGTFQTTQNIILGADGTGVLELSSTGTVKAAAIVVSNTVGQAASYVKFMSDAEGRFGTIDPATKLAFAEGSKIVIDAATFPEGTTKATLFSLNDDIGGLDYIKQHVELVNAPENAVPVWSEDGRRLRFRVARGMMFVVR